MSEEIIRKLDELAQGLGELKAGQSRLEQRFDRLEQRFDGLDKSLTESRAFSSDNFGQILQVLSALSAKINRTDPPKNIRAVN